MIKSIIKYRQVSTTAGTFLLMLDSNHWYSNMANSLNSLYNINLFKVNAVSDFVHLWNINSNTKPLDIEHIPHNSSPDSCQ